MSPQSKTQRLFAALLLVACLLSPFVCRAAEEDDKPDLLLADIADEFRKHCVQVYIHGKSHDGKLPTTGSFANNVRNERPTLVGGYWWDDRHIVIEDPVLQDDFIRDIEIAVPGSPTRYPATIAGRFIKLQAILLEVQPAADGFLPPSHPLTFVDGDVDECAVLAYEWNLGSWGLTADSGLGQTTLTDDGVEMAKLGSKGVFVSEDGLTLGLAFGERLIVNEEDPYWFGRELPYTPILGATDAGIAKSKLGGMLARSVLEARFGIRIKIDEEDEDESYDWTIDLDEGQSRGAPAEIRATAIMVGPRHFLVPLQVPAEGIARIDGIRVIADDGRELEATFSGALRDYMAVVIEISEDLSTEYLPNGFALLNPFVSGSAAEQTPYPAMQYIQRWRIDYSLGRRREIADYDRWLGTFHGYRGDSVVNTFTNEEDGSLAFDVEGNLVAVSLTPRVISSQNKGGYAAYNRNQNIVATPGFRPLDFLSARLRGPDAFDPAMLPVDEDNGQRLIDIGVEYQGLDANTARLFTASAETRGGRIGLLVNYVYPGLMADEVGIKEQDILLRLFVEGKNEPMELRAGGYGGRGFMDFSDMSSQSFQQMLQYMPPPWPSRDDVISSLLTATGVGRKVVLEYLREGESKRAEFVTQFSAPDYRNAKKERFTTLGMTVKPITYEVQRYFRRADAGGVIVSKVEDGGKSSVAGMHHYLLITMVNGESVKDVADFKQKVEKFESGEASSIELTVEGFGKTRLVKIE